MQNQLDERSDSCKWKMQLTDKNVIEMPTCLW